MRQAWSYAGFALFLAAAVEIAVLFYFGGCTALVSAQSSSITIELALTQIRAHPDATVAVLGNSTAAEGFLAEWFDQHAGGVKALNLGVPSANMYFYERLLSLAMKKGIRPRALVLMVTPDLLSPPLNFDDVLNDLTMLRTVLDSSDLMRLAGHARTVQAYADYAARVVVRPILFRSDLRDFFRHPRERLAEGASLREWLDGLGPQSPMIEVNHSFSVCEIGSLSELPQTIQRLRNEGRASLAADYQRVQQSFVQRAHVPMKVDVFEAARFRRMLDHLKSVSPAVYVIAAPYYDPNFEQYPTDYRKSFDEALRQVTQSVPGVTLLPDFQADCSMLFDTVHLNRKGGEQFTEYLRARVL